MNFHFLTFGLSLLTLGVVAESAAGSQFMVESADLKNGHFETKFVANGFGCTGGNISPEIKWQGAPVGTKSFALIMHDPDAPTGVGGFTHWIVVNIPASETGLAKGAGNGKLPYPAIGVQNGFQDTGVTGVNGNYGGPCPPIGDKPHRYVFTLYALGIEDIYAASGIPKTASTAVHGFILNKGLGSNLLGTASFTATYGH